MNLSQCDICGVLLIKKAFLPQYSYLYLFLSFSLSPLCLYIFLSLSRSLALFMHIYPAIYLFLLCPHFSIDCFLSLFLYIYLCIRLDLFVLYCSHFFSRMHSLTLSVSISFSLYLSISNPAESLFLSSLSLFTWFSLCPLFDS